MARRHGGDASVTNEASYRSANSRSAPATDPAWMGSVIRLEAMICPACRAGDGRPIQRHSVEAATEHFVPRGRDETRHGRLVEHLRTLWEGDSVELQQCDRCGFGFAVPWVGGDAEFYALAHAGDPHYPRDRWEFGETLSTLARRDMPGALRVLEVGAGDGAFLDRLRELPTGRIRQIVAADLDAGACRRLRE